MNIQELLELHEEICDTGRDLMAKKNADYASEDDLFKNFKVCELMGYCDMQTGMMVRITDKLSRIGNALSGGEYEVKDESLRDTVIDAINYLVLLYASMGKKGDIKESLLENERFLFDPKDAKNYSYGIIPGGCFKTVGVLPTGDPE